jgi:hypothetical protein
MNNIKVQLVEITDQPNYLALKEFIGLNLKNRINNIFSSLFLYNKVNFNSLKKIILSNIKYKKITGVRLSLAGRLTRRYTAARAAYKIKY